jgi:phenylalanyl-tRNA synthetase beta chain
MKVPLGWLKEYVDINVDPKEFAEAITLSGSKVEGIEVQGEEISKVVVGRILTVEKHPDADRLQVAKIDIGSEVVQVVTGAWNINEGDYIPVALHGSMLPGGKKITKGKLRGIKSNGMMCSMEELCVDKEDYPDANEDGIFILKGNPVPGTDIKEFLGLNETIVEFEITSNRPDCLSIVGIAREAAATFKSKLVKPVIKLEEKADNAVNYASVQIKDPDLCPRYAARIIKDVKIGASPKWMKNRLKAAGVRPINNIVDITNYVMLELGQPMHAFDFECLEENRIVVRRALDGETINTLDEQDRELDSSMLVIADGKKPVAVAGVMGGAKSEVTEKTSMILLESANFNGISVRLAAKKLGMRTEASSRFEKGLDMENVITAIDRAAQLIEELGAGRVCKGIIDCYPKKETPRTVKFRPDKINELLGTSISIQEMKDIFKALEFELDESTMEIIVPSFRYDIEGGADLAEEVARFYGYNNIEATLLSGKAATLGRKTFKQKVEDKIKNTLISCGLSEIYTYSFTSPKVFDKINVAADSKLRQTVVISNPLGEDYSIMRTTTIPDMLAVISRNYNRKVEEAKLFELSYVYLPKKLPVTDLPEEKTVLTLGMYGSLDFFDLKGAVEELMSILGICRYEFVPEKSNPTFHPGRTARLMINRKDAGIIGQIHPEVAQRFECPGITYIGLLDAACLIENTVMEVEYKPLPKFPAVTRDVAIIVKDEVMVKEIEGIIEQRAGRILEVFKLFDIYKGKQVPEGMKSAAFSITFRDENRTLTDEDVNKAMDKILEGLRDSLGAKLRE